LKYPDLGFKLIFHKERKSPQMVKGITVWKEFNLSVFPLLYFHDRYRKPLYSKKTPITSAIALTIEIEFPTIKVFSK